MSSLTIRRLPSRAVAKEQACAISTVKEIEDVEEELIR